VVTMDTKLRILNLSCAYGTHTVLENVSLDVRRGDFVGIIGPNGAGKTTLIRALTRNARPVSGKILHRGRDIAAFSPRDFARIVAFLPAEMDLFFSYTVEEFVSIGRFPFTGRFSGMKEKDVDAVRGALEMTDTARLRERNVWELSAGEKQRVLLAQVISQQTPLLLLDEPVAHLDIGHQFRIMDLLRQLNRRGGKTIITVLHDLNLASDYCSRIVLLNRGTVTARGTPQEVLTYPNIEQAYDTKVVVSNNPVTGKPYVVGVPAELLGKNSEEQRVQSKRAGNSIC